MKLKPKTSCRFAPYYRVQRFDEVSQVWRPLRGMFATEAKAREFAPDGKIRIELVAEGGRKFI